MYFCLDTKKAIEATATLVRLASHRLMGRKRLLALLYLADRESLKQTGRPIIGGRLVAMDYGPIHSEVYDLIKGGHQDQVEWSRHFQNDNFYVKLAEDLGVSELSESEVGLLNSISDRFLGYDDWDVAEQTHKFEEYTKNHRTGTSTPIPLTDLDLVDLLRANLLTTRKRLSANLLKKVRDGAAMAAHLLPAKCKIVLQEQGLL